jgi:hypothetical protein
VLGFFKDNFPPPDDLPHAFFLNQPGELFQPLPEVFVPKIAAECKYVSTARAINDSGVIVGYISLGKSLTPDPTYCLTGYDEAARWEPPAFTPQGLIGTFHPDRSLDINNHGLIIGYTQNLDHYFLWNGDPFKYIGLYVDPSNPFHTNGIHQVAGINDYGRAVANGYLPGSGGARHALFWKKAGASSLDLGTLSGGKESLGYEINNQNMIAGTADRPRRKRPGSGSLVLMETVGFLWHKDFGMRALPKLPSDTPNKCEAYSLNDRASSPPRLVQVVGYCTLAGKRHAVRWDVTISRRG